jgi:hypothetical protein
MAPPASVARTAVFSFFAEVTRWNTSCCGMEPMASVIQAARNASHSLAPPLGQNSNLPASAAAAITLPVPPAMSLTSQAIATRPTRITTDWNRSVIATDHMPPQMV